MSNLITSLAWCWLQVLLVAGTAIALSLLALRRSPAASATIAWSGVAASLVLAGLTFVPLPTPLMHRTFGELVRRPAPVAETGISKLRQDLQIDQSAPDEASFGAILNGPLLAQLIESLRNSQSAAGQHRRAARWALFVLVFGSAVGLVRLVRGLISIAALRRRSTVVTDRHANDLAGELSRSLPLHCSPPLYETGDLNSAAVVGWWRPVVLLPADWRTWTHAELKAVLAHELAHIARHDAWWRLVTTLAVVLHWGQPLIYWLRRQLLLAQELAADELAAAAIGQREYLQALAKLALRQDSRSAIVPPSALLPVFSGFLLRRIVMLRAKDGSTRRDWRRLTQGSAVALVMTIAFLSAAIRGLAEPPEIDSDGSIRVAKSTDAKPKPAKPIVNSSAEATSFLRPPIDISKFALAKNGGSLLRLGEICQQPRFAQFVRKYDVQLAESWKATFLGAEAPPFSLQDIEYIVGDCMFTARVVKPPKEETNPHPHQICFGVSYGFIRWQKPVDKIVAWLNRTPGAEQKQHGEVSYVELPRGLLGPEQVYVCSVDDHTILWSGGEATFLKRLDKFLAATDPPAWHNAWKEVEGGLFTAIAAETQYKVSPDFTTEPDELTREFFDKTRLLGVSLDWQPQEHGDMTYKIHARFDSEADARSIEVVARRALELAIQEARQDAEKSANENNELAEKNKLFATSVIALLQSALIETSESETGWQINVRLSGPIDIESGL